MQLIALQPAHNFMIRGEYTANDHAAIVIFLHGLGSSRKGEKAIALRTAAVGRGWAFAAFDFHGHGESDGSMLELRGYRLLQDIAAIVRFAQEQGHTKIFLVGSSMGAWASAWFTVQHEARVTACAFIAPAFRFLEFRWLTTTQKQQWELTGSLELRNEWIELSLHAEFAAEQSKFNFRDLLTHYTVPCLTIHGTNDTVCAYQDSVDFTADANASNAELLLLKNGDHRLAQQKEFLAQMCCDFFARFLPACA